MQGRTDGWVSYKLAMTWTERGHIGTRFDIVEERTKDVACSPTPER